MKVDNIKCSRARSDGSCMEVYFLFVYFLVAKLTLYFKLVLYLLSYISLVH